MMVMLLQWGRPYNQPFPPLSEFYYIQAEKSRNLVRIKNRGPVSSESPAPIAVDYAGVTSAAEAADQTAMAFR